MLGIAGLLHTRHTDSAVALVPYTLYPRSRPSRNGLMLFYWSLSVLKAPYILTATRTWSRNDEWRAPAIGTAALCTWFLKENAKKKGSASPQLLPSCLPVTWSISGKDCQEVCNLKLCSGGLSPGSTNQIVGCDLLATIFPVTPHARQETTPHQQPLEQRFLPLPQHINKDLEEVQLSVKAVLVWEVIVHRCTVQLSSPGNFHLL